ncbi:MraY family glycosyltransferase [Flagellimonas marinaquae]
MDSQLFLTVTFQGILTFLLALYLYPLLVKIGRGKNLVASFNRRSSHKDRVSVLGGFGVFFVFFVLVFVGVLHLGYGLGNTEILGLLFAGMIFFFAGFLDDALDITALRKFSFQLVGTLVFLMASKLVFEDFGGLFGLHDIPLWLSWVISIFIMQLGVNAFNLIDGVDGLAASLAAVGFGMFGVSFLLHGDHPFAIMAFAGLFAVMGFLPFNFSKRYKIFLGDSGSLFVGFLLSGFSLKYVNEVHAVNASDIAGYIVWVLTVFSYPLTDVIRVFIVRVKNGKSPFRPDRKHLHHFALDRGWKHYQITLLYISYTGILLVLQYGVLSFLNAHWGFALILVSNLLLALLPSLYGKIRPAIRMETS